MSKQLNQDEIDAFSKRFKQLIFGLVALLALPLIGYAVYLHWRLNSFEHSLRYRPPEDQLSLNQQNENAPPASFLLPDKAVQGQLVYVPAYSHIYHQDGSPCLLTITLSVRNTSVQNSITVRSIRYFDSQGKEIRSYLDSPIRIAPLGTTEVLVKKKDVAGGSGANFLVEWLAETEVTEPLIEAVMIDTSGQQGISFARSGQAIRDLTPKPNAD